MIDCIKVKKDSKSGSVAGAIAGLLRAGGDIPPVAAIGSQAIYVAVKSIMIATKFLENDGIVPVVRIEQCGSKEGAGTRILFVIRGEKSEQRDGIHQA